MADPFNLIMAKVANQDLMNRSLMATNAAKQNAAISGAANVGVANTEAKSAMVSDILRNSDALTRDFGSEQFWNVITQAMGNNGFSVPQQDFQAGRNKGMANDRLDAATLFSGLFRDIAEGTGTLVDKAGIKPNIHDLMRMEEDFGYTNVPTAAQVSASARGSGGGRDDNPGRDNIARAYSRDGRVLAEAETTNDLLTLLMLQGVSPADVTFRTETIQKYPEGGRTPTNPLSNGPQVFFNEPPATATSSNTQQPEQILSTKDGWSFVRKADGSLVFRAPDGTETPAKAK